MTPARCRYRASGFARFFVARERVFVQLSVPSVPFDISVGERGIAFVVSEALQGADLNGDGLLSPLLFFFDREERTVHGPLAIAVPSDCPEMTCVPDSSFVRLGPKWLVFDAFGQAARSGRPFVGSFVADALRLPELKGHFLCTGPGGLPPGIGLVRAAASFSDSLIPCILHENGAQTTLNTDFDLNGDGDFDDAFLGGESAENTGARAVVCLGEGYAPDNAERLVLIRDASSRQRSWRRRSLRDVRAARVGQHAGHESR